MRGDHSCARLQRARRGRARTVCQVCLTRVERCIPCLLRFEGHLHGLVKTLDTNFSVERRHERSEQPPVDANECGVGMELEYDPYCGAWCVAGLKQGGAAASCGVAPGDLLRFVDWKPVTGRAWSWTSTLNRMAALAEWMRALTMLLDAGRSRREVQQMIHGAAGSAVTLELASAQTGAQKIMCTCCRHTHAHMISDTHAYGAQAFPST